MYSVKHAKSAEEHAKSITCYSNQLYTTLPSQSRPQKSKWQALRACHKPAKPAKPTNLQIRQNSKSKSTST
jgi:hypothetical protein